MTMLILVTAGSVGTLCRYLVSAAVQQLSVGLFPVGTAAVNLIGAFILGMVMGGADLDSAWATAIIGFTGGFTTFSTWMVETLRLGDVPRLRMWAIANLTVLLVLGTALAAAGFWLTH